MAIVFKGKVFSVEVGTFRFPNGTQHQMEIVRHPPSVVLIPVPDDGRVILIRQFRAPLGRDIWEFPAGSLNAGESAEAAAARECEEEVALVPRRVERLLGLYPSPGFCDEEMIFFRVSDLQKPAPASLHKPDEDEDIHVQVFTIAEAKAMAARGEIIDLKTAFGLTLI
jgi:8-oxo-dGTP pyrophosphatase MutT (NUDIX family)